MIKNIVFDMGQVLMHWSPKLLTKDFELSEEEKTVLEREVFKGIEWIQVDRGAITTDMAYESISKRLPESLHIYARDILYDWWKKPIIPMEGMADLIKQLKSEGYDIFLLSNASLALRSYFNRIPGSEYFDGIFVSAEHRYLKPQFEIYNRFFDTFGLVPSECLFIDDKPENIEGAGCVGMDGIVFFGDVNRLRRELEEKIKNKAI